MPENSIYIIAEAGVNHNGSPSMALELVKAAASAGANAVKFQTFQADKLAAKSSAKAAYQIESTGNSESQWAMLKRLELNRETHILLLKRCRELDIDFLSTPFDPESLDFLAYDLKLPRLKISSGDLTNAPLLLQAARTGKPLILSTGLSTLAEIEQALSVLAFGYISPDRRPSLEAFVEAWAAEAGQWSVRKKVALLHCTTEYPAPWDEVNLKVMDTLHLAFGLATGYSDHTQGIAIPIAAAARGAVIIEKHFTLSRELPGPDHQASLEPDELKTMVKSIRQVEQALGSGLKHPTASEWKNRDAARKSLVATRTIASGEPLTVDNLGVKRPGSGISPIRYWEMLGRTALHHYEADDVIEK